MPKFDSQKTYEKGAADYKVGIKENPYKRANYQSAWYQGWFDEGYNNDPAFKRNYDINAEGYDAFFKGITECPYTAKPDIDRWQTGWEEGKNYRPRTRYWDTD